MYKFLILTHRWLGITLSLILLLWCLSGFVMMYKPYPELSQEQILGTLEPLSLDGCCTGISDGELTGQQYSLFHLLMLKGDPVLHLYSDFGDLHTYNLTSGRAFHDVSEQDATLIARQYADRAGYPLPTLQASIHNDQWTVYGSYNPYRPLYHFSANDGAGTEWYISSRTGEIVQYTTREQRIWGYLGAVIHWLYPTMLRERAQLWNQTIIWLSSLGTILTLTGLYFGIKQYRRRKNGRHSPYHGMLLWHHYTGLIFGFLTFTWVLSGLFSMQPWGLFEPGGAGRESQLLSGGSISLEEVNAALAGLEDSSIPADTVVLEGKYLAGEFMITAYSPDLSKQLYAAPSISPAPLDEAKLLKLSTAIADGQNLLEAGMLNEEDSYYFSHHNTVSLPVYRIILDNAETTRYYLDPADGRLLAKYDAANKGFRWFHLGLHRLDFTPAMRSRPVWDIFMWILLSGVTFGVFTGLYIGVKRLYRSF